MRNDPLWVQAKQAESAGNVALAMQLYAQLARETMDPQLRNDCYNQIQFLKDGNRGSAPPGAPAPVPGGAVPGPGPGATMAGYGSRPPAPPVPTQSSGPGRLRRAGFFIDYQQAYVLEDSQGRPLMYVTGSGLNLELYCGQAVELYGSIVYRGDLRTNYLTATQARLLP
jgi:hypothetical protein